MRPIDAYVLDLEYQEKLCSYIDCTECTMANKKDGACLIEQWIYAQQTVDAIPVVRCRECKWYEPRHILHADGTRTYVDEDAKPVTIDVGINCAGRCIYHVGLKIYCVNHDRENQEDEQNIVIFRSPDDFCSYGERKR